MPAMVKIKTCVKDADAGIWSSHTVSPPSLSAGRIEDQDDQQDMARMGRKTELKVRKVHY